jgi:hypothetical protein
MKNQPAVRSDFARGQRQDERTLYEVTSDFARGQRTLPVPGFGPEDGSDFALGQRVWEKDPLVQPDFARGQRSEELVPTSAGKGNETRKARRSKVKVR